MLRKKWLLEIPRRAMAGLRPLLRRLSQAASWLSSRLDIINGSNTTEATMSLSRSRPNSGECASSSTELKIETPFPGPSTTETLQDSRNDCATSNGPSSPVVKISVLDKHGTIALILASFACGAIMLGSMWMPYMMAASAEKANSRAQQAVVTSELTKRDLEELRRRVDIFEERGKWVEK